MIDLTNGRKLQTFKQVDFVKYTYPAYENAGQFRQYNQFLIDNTDGSYLFYDSENETNLKFLVALMAAKDGYQTQFLTFEDLNELAAEE